MGLDKSPAAQRLGFLLDTLKVKEFYWKKCIDHAGHRVWPLGLGLVLGFCCCLGVGWELFVHLSFQDWDLNSGTSAC
jgi:hypothetical protein